MNTRWLYTATPVKAMLPIKVHQPFPCLFRQSNVDYSPDY